MLNSITTDLFEFEDPRAYLKKVFDEHHQIKPRYYTYRKFAEILGFSNKGFIYNYMYPNGKHGDKCIETKKLTDQHCGNISNALNHTPVETRYFLCIVHADQAPDKKNRLHNLKEAAKIRVSTKIGLVTNEQLEFYAHWYNSAIRSLLDIYPIKEGDNQFCSMLTPPITPTQAKASIRLLQKLGFITVSNDGCYKLTTSIINTGRDIPQDLKNSSHLEYLTLAGKAIKDLPSDSRYAISHTIGVSEPTYREITKEIESFRASLRNLIENDKNPERVYQLEIVLFPLSTKKSLTKERK